VGVPNENSDVRGESPHPPRSTERVGLPRKRERRRVLRLLARLARRCSAFAKASADTSTTFAPPLPTVAMGPGSRPGRRVCLLLDSIFKQSPSLRALAKQSISLRIESMDCFVASAPRNDVEKWVRIPAARCARVLRVSSAQESAGNAGRPMRPIAACAMSVVERTRVSQVTPESPGIPRAMVLRLISCSPRRPGFLATVARAP
jgi:hypothetical protein